MGRKDRRTERDQTGKEGRRGGLTAGGERGLVKHGRSEA